MKNSTEILLKSRENQLVIDALIQTVVAHSFNGGVITGIKNYGTSVINYLRGIEQQLFSKLGVSYTYTAYNPATSYMLRVPLPQIDQAYFIKTYYITRLTTMVNEMIAQTAHDASTQNNLNFISDNNQVYTKGTTWTTNQQLAIDRINDLIATIVADTFDQS